MRIKALAFDAYGTVFDPNSVSRAVEAAFPGRGEWITGIWRQKQLEYSWQRTAMGFFGDFRALTRDALAYAVATVTEEVEGGLLDDLTRAFDRLDLFPDAAASLASLGHLRLAILSNGSRSMLTNLLDHGGIAGLFETVVSADDAGAYKPDPRVYQAVVDRLGLPAAEIALVSGNGFDLAGARHFGLATIRIERVAPARLRAMVAEGPKAATAFGAIRSQMDGFAGPPDLVCSSLSEVVAALSTA